jgi:hypothetical protein
VYTENVIENANSKKEENTNRKDNKSKENLKRKNNVVKKLTITEFRQPLPRNNTFKNMEECRAPEEAEVRKEV